MGPQVLSKVGDCESLTPRGSSWSGPSAIRQSDERNFYSAKLCATGRDDWKVEEGSDTCTEKSHTQRRLSRSPLKLHAVGEGWRLHVADEEVAAEVSDLLDIIQLVRGQVRT